MLGFYDGAGRPVPDKDFYNLKRFLAEDGTLLGWINYDDYKKRYPGAPDTLIASYELICSGEVLGASLARNIAATD
ncbi:MAG TPA: hypothetical protein VF648_00570 [Pyrinomonadaceae bacterium]|jgi:hypothetical protein